ncbi:MAG TPA: hypothetical protein VFH54_06455 [Mycobacteriales bacterium]|nr:hypothetical protein [Mycobacteriales bacterium]
MSCSADDSEAIHDAGAVAATPAFDSIGPWTNVNDVLDVIVPAGRAFDRAVGAAAQD